MICRRIHAAFISFGLALAAGLPVQAAESVAVSGAAIPRELPPPALNVMRQRSVAIDRGAMLGAIAKPALALRIDLFDDVSVLVSVKRTELTHSGGMAYVGDVLGDKNGMAVIVDNDGVISGKFVAYGRRFSLRGNAEMGYVAAEHVGFDRPDHAPTTIDLLGRNIVPLDAPSPKADPVGPIVMADDGSTMDVLVAYTPAARATAGGTAAINADVDAEIVITNTAYANSNVVQRLRLVYKGETTYTESGDSSIDLGRVQGTNDGYMDEVPMLRDLYKADFVSLWANITDACGIGYLMTPERAAFHPLAYNVVSWDCTGPGAYTFAHELGHNMGLRHDNAVDGNSTTVSPEGAPVDPGATIITYAHGYVDTTNRFRTVMAYNNACVSLGFNCTRIQHFSNPAISYNNNGVYAPAVLATTGNASTANERQALNDTRETTANFRAGLTTFTGPGIVTFLSTTYSVNEGGGTVQLRVGRHVGSTGTITVNYATSNGTATAGSDFTTTNATLTWVNGDTADQFINVPILQDSALEGKETFTVTLSTPTGGASIGSSGGVTQAATVTIVDDEPDTFPIGSLLPGHYVSTNVPNANAANSQWTVDLTDGYLSPASLQSAQMFSPTNDLSTFGNSDMTYTGVFLAGNVTFRYKLSSYQTLAGPNQYSGLDFLIDGVVVPGASNTAGGEVPWTAATAAITAGAHTLTWRFKNRLYVSCALGWSPLATGGANCKDRAWVDNIVMPLAPKFDLSGEGRTDLVWKHTDGRQAIWLMNGTAPTATAEIIGAATGWNVVGVADMNGDSKGDLVWQHTDGRAAIYLMNGTTPTSTTQILNAGPWTIIHAPDLNGDGKSDLVFQNSDGSVAVWTMNGATMTSGASIIGAGTGWSVIKTGDFDGDGNDDLLWRHTDGRHAIWLMNGAVIKSTGQILNAGGWTAAHVADLDGDGRADIVWQHTDGTVALWLMNGAAMASGSGLLGAGTGWSVVRTGDFDGDGKKDLLFMHTDGRAAIYLMNGLVTKASAEILAAGGGWTAKRTGDLNGDGKADIVWENVDGRSVVWLMNGTALLSPGVRILVGGTGWSVQSISQ